MMVQKRRAAAPGQPDSDEDPTYVYSRAEDRSRWMRVSYVLDKYKVLFYIGVAIAVSAGYGFKTPKTAMDEVRASISRLDTASNRRIDSTNARLAAIERLTVSVEAMVRIRCVESPPETLRLAGIDCGAWLNNTPPRPRTP